MFLLKGCMIAYGQLGAVDPLALYSVIISYPMDAHLSIPTNSLTRILQQNSLLLSLADIIAL